MNTYDLIDVYMFNCVSTKHLKLSKPGCSSMVEEMNEIRGKYLGSAAHIADVIKQCVCVRHGHQYCIPKVAVDKAVDVLTNPGLKVVVKNMTTDPFLGGKKFAQFTDFEELYDFIRQQIGDISGIGPLTVYDTAKRIGHLLNPPIYPKQYVYLSAGAVDGAKSLLGRNVKFREPIDVFKPYFGTFGSIFIEDILCIFKSEFAAGLSTVSIATVIKKARGALNKKSTSVATI